jgi:hypothetical protein
MVLRKSFLWLSVFVLVFTGSASALAPAGELGWEQIVPGIEYQEFQLPDPNNVYVARMDRTNPGVILESMIAQGKLSEGRETVSDMYARYDEAINYWGGSANPPTWGMRNQAVVAINGFYFDWNSGVPVGGQVQSGWYAKRFDDLGGGSGFAWKLDRSAFIGECVYHRPEKQLITYHTGITQQITHVNTQRDADELILFTPQYNSHTGTDTSGVEVLVEMTRPTMILPAPAYALGIVRQIRDGGGDSLIPFNSIVLSASGTAAQTLLENVHIGDEIHISQEITSYEGDCITPYSDNWTKTYASIAGDFYFLKNGQIKDYDASGANVRDPRTAIAFNSQYIFFLVVDGRDAQHSIGMTIHQLAVFTRDTLGATWGLAQDGGGSSTMVINGQVMNNTFCNNYICSKYAVYLPLVINKSDQAQSVLMTESDIVSTSAGVERLVANGMLMVVAQPGAYSTAFSPGDVVKTSANTDIRLGPGTNYTAITSLSGGAQGTIMEQMNGLNGVLAKSNYWWYVSFPGITGWVMEGALVKSVSGIK